LRDIPGYRGTLCRRWNELLKFTGKIILSYALPDFFIFASKKGCQQLRCVYLSGMHYFIHLAGHGNLMEQFKPNSTVSSHGFFMSFRIDL